MVQFQKCFHCGRLCTFEKDWHPITQSVMRPTSLTRDHIITRTQYKFAVPLKHRNKQAKFRFNPNLLTVPSCRECNNMRNDTPFGDFKPSAPNTDLHL